MFEAVLHDNEELLEWRVVGVQGASKTEGRLDQAFDAELGHVQQVGSLHRHRVPQSWTGKETDPHLGVVNSNTTYSVSTKESCHYVLHSGAHKHTAR